MPSPAKCQAEPDLLPFTEFLHTPLVRQVVNQEHAPTVTGQPIKPLVFPSRPRRGCWPAARTFRSSRNGSATGSIATTEKYLHTLPDADETALNALE